MAHANFFARRVIPMGNPSGHYRRKQRFITAQRPSYPAKGNRAVHPPFENDCHGKKRNFGFMNALYSAEMINPSSPAVTEIAAGKSSQRSTSSVAILSST